MKNKNSTVRTKLIASILISLFVSWILAAGISNYVNFLEWKSFRSEVMKERLGREPKFTAWEFFTGRSPMMGRRPMEGRRPPEFDRRPMGERPPRDGRPPEFREGGPGRGPRREFARAAIIQSGVLRVALAALITIIAGMLISKIFTKPLKTLTEGAEKFTEGDFDHRIPDLGPGEFNEVAESMNAMAAKVSEQIADLEEDSRRRMRFLADVAHELRSPVTTLQTMASALVDGTADNPERRERAVNSIMSTSDRLLGLVRDLTDYAKLDLEDFSVNKRNFDLAALLETIAETKNREAAARNMTVRFVSDLKSFMYNAAPDRITQIVDNAAGNALAYAGEESSVVISLEVDDDVKVKIADNGKGISSADLPFVTDAFYRASKSRTPGEGHSGLGLSIASRLAEAHGGKISVESVEGAGTPVVLTLPKQRN